ncbi:pickpocket 13 [Carabus blaptoides fortunei]
MDSMLPPALFPVFVLNYTMSVLRDYLLQSSFHGLHFVAERRLHYSERLFWLVCVLACWSGSVYLMYSSLQFSYENPITLSVDNHYLHRHTRLPAMVVCDTGNTRVPREAHRIFDDDPKRFLQKKKNFEQTVFFVGTLTDNILFKYPGNMSYYRSLRSSCDDIFNYCVWNKTAFACCDHFLLLETVFGPCYALNSIHTNRTKTLKMEMGLHSELLELEFKNPQVSIYVVGNEEVPMYKTTAVVKSVDLYKYEVRLSVMETITDPDVRQVQVARRKCRFPDENYLDVAKLYSFGSCKLQCQKNEHMSLYNCTHLYMPYAKQKEICDDVQLVRLAKGFKEWTKEDNKMCECELSCMDMDISVVSTIASKVDITQTNWKNGTRSSAHIHCQSVYNKVLRKKAKNILDNIVSLGGTAGLFVVCTCVGICNIYKYTSHDQSTVNSSIIAGILDRTWRHLTVPLFTE